MIFNLELLALLVIAILSSKLVDGSVSIYSFESGLVKIAPSHTTPFGPILPVLNGLRGLAYAATQYEICGPMEPPPKNVTFQDLTLPKWLALIPKNDCAIDVKVKSAQDAGYDGVIVYSGDFENEKVKKRTNQSITIPSVIIDEASGQMLIENFQFTQGYIVVLTDDFYYYLFMVASYIVLAVFAFAVTMFIMWIHKCVSQFCKSIFIRYKLEYYILRRLKTSKFSVNDASKSCIICWDDYEEGDSLMILPCKHGFHSKCIERWLFKKLKCPVCKLGLKLFGMDYTETSV